MPMQEFAKVNELACCTEIAVCQTALQRLAIRKSVVWFGYLSSCEGELRESE
jgi:hypothetical protein